MSTFHPFPQLPAELRIRIFELSIELRTVEVRLHGRLGFNEPHWLYTTTPIPAILQTCREARGLGLYEQITSELASHTNTPQPTEQRYVWVNYDSDTISIGRDTLQILDGIKHSVKRLRFERKGPDESWGFYGLHTFTDVQEIHVVLCNGSEIRDWHGASRYLHWPCEADHVIIVDPRRGEKMRLSDLENKYDREVEEESDLNWHDLGLRYTF